MKTLGSGLSTHLTLDCTTLTLCWRVVRTDAVEIRGTAHDRDLEVNSGGALDGLYLAKANISGSAVRSNSDLAVDNLEVEGAVSDDLNLVDLSAADIEAGLLDDAEVWIFAVNWADLTQGEIVLRRGFIGSIVREAEGRYRTELRGLAQRYQQQVIRSYSIACNAELGDARCGVDLGPLTITGEVTSVTSRRLFAANVDVSSPEEPPSFFVGGLLTFTAGDNQGYSKEIKQETHAGGSGTIELFEPMPADIEVGDQFTIRPGCDKTQATCRDRFLNLVNFRGYALFTPTQNEALKIGGQ